MNKDFFNHQIPNSFCNLSLKAKLKYLKNPIPKVACYETYLSLLTERNRLVNSLNRKSKFENALEEREKAYNNYTNGANRNFIARPFRKCSSRSCQMGRASPHLLNRPRPSQYRNIRRRAWTNTPYQIMSETGSMLSITNPDEENIEEEFRMDAGPLTKPPSSNISFPFETSQLEDVKEEDSLATKDDLLLNDIFNFKDPMSSNSVGGLMLKIDLFSNWGHPKRIGLTEVEFLDAQMKKITVLSVIDINCSNSKGTVTNLINGKTKTPHENSMWSTELITKDNYFPSLVFTLPFSSFLSFIKIWNYNKSAKEIDIGARRVAVTVSGTTLFQGELQKGTGLQMTDYSQLIMLIHPETSVSEDNNWLPELDAHSTVRRHSLLSTLNKMEKKPTTDLRESLDWLQSDRQSSAKNDSEISSSECPFWFEDFKLTSSREQINTESSQKPLWFEDTLQEDLKMDSIDSALKRDSLQESILVEQMAARDNYVLYGRRAKTASQERGHSGASFMSSFNGSDSLLEKSWSSLHKFEQSHKGRLTLDNEREVSDMRLSTSSGRDSLMSTGQLSQNFDLGSIPELTSTDE